MEVRGQLVQDPRVWPSKHTVSVFAFCLVLSQESAWRGCSCPPVFFSQSLQQKVWLWLKFSTPLNPHGNVPLPISRSPSALAQTGSWQTNGHRRQTFCSPPLKSLGQFPLCLLDLQETPHTKDWERQSWKSGRGEKQSSEQEHSPGKDGSEPGGQGWCLRGSRGEQSITLLGKTAPLCVHLPIHPSLHAPFQLVFTECPPSLMFSRSSQSTGDVRAPNKSPDHELQIDLRAWKEQQGSGWGNVWPLL